MHGVPVKPTTILILLNTPIFPDSIHAGPEQNKHLGIAILTNDR